MIDHEAKSPSNETHEQPESSHGREVSQARQGLHRAMAILVGIVLAFFFGELAVRLFVAERDVDVVFQNRFRLSSNPVLEYELVPNSRDGHLSISDDGIRGRNYLKGKNAGVYRIVIVGDSVTYGYHLLQGEAYPARFEKILNQYARPVPPGVARKGLPDRFVKSARKRKSATSHSLDAGGGPNFEVLNLGVTGYNISQCVENLRVRGLKYHPDLVIYGYALNDPQAYSLEADALALLKRRAETGLSEKASIVTERVLRFSRLLSFVVAQFRTKAWFERIPHLSDPGFVAFGAGKQREYFRALHDNPKTWARVRNGFARLANVTTTAGDVPVLVVVIPIDEGNGIAPYALADVHDKVIKEAGANHLAAIDMTDDMRSAYTAYNHNLYLDFMHLSPVGAQVLALALYKSLSKRKLLPKRALPFNTVTDWRGDDGKIVAALAESP